LNRVLIMIIDEGILGILYFNEKMYCTIENLIQFTTPEQIYIDGIYDKDKSIDLINGIFRNLEIIKHNNKNRIVKKLPRCYREYMKIVNVSNRQLNSKYLVSINIRCVSSPRLPTRHLLRLLR
jgi:hypothetical protein